MPMTNRNTWLGKTSAVGVGGGPAFRLRMRLGERRTRKPADAVPDSAGDVTRWADPYIHGSTGDLRDNWTRQVGMPQRTAALEELTGRPDDQK